MARDVVAYKKMYLKNGIRVVSERVSSSRCVSVGIWVNTGSRDEITEEGGICHLLEHMLFKGTKKRDVRRLACEIDAIGGELSAFTTKETTTYYVNVLDESLDIGIDLLSDIFLNSLIKEDDIQKEIQVIRNEILMAEDDPEDLVDEIHSSNIWGSQPLGMPILGQSENLERINRNALKKFMKDSYYPSNIVIGVSGNFKPLELEKSLESSFGLLEAGRQKSKAASSTPVWLGKQLDAVKDLEQTQLAFSMKGLAVNHEQRYVLVLLNSILGGSVSSRLFQEVRENKGLAYSIYSETVAYRDVGELNVFATVQREKKDEVLELITTEVEHLRNNGISARELLNAKGLLKSEFIFGLESVSRRMSRIANDELYFGQSFSPEEVLYSINAVTEDDIENLIKDLFNEKYYCTTTLGPINT